MAKSTSNSIRSTRLAGYSRIPAAPGRMNRVLCDFCGGKLDAFHDGPACAEAWLRKLDAEGNPSNTRRRPC